MMTTFASARLICMILLNAFGVILFIGFASQCWIEPELANEPGASGGDAMVWGVTALPILAAFVLIDFLWLIFECIAYLMKKTWRLGLAFLVIPVLVVPVMWAIAIYVDNSHHGM
jgi:hypothetical protein